MKHLVLWLNSIDPTYLSAWATVTSAVSSIALLIATVWLGRLTKILAFETKLTRLANERAQVDCSIQPDPSSISLLNLVLLNSGKSPAQAVKIEVTRGGNFHHTDKPVFPFTTLIPGERKEIFIGSYLQMKEKTFCVTVSYKDKAGGHSFTYEQDLLLWSNLTQARQDPQADLIKKLDEIKRTLDGWTSFGRLRITAYTRNEAEKEQQQFLERQAAALERRAEQDNEPPPSDEDDEPPIGA